MKCRQLVKLLAAFCIGLVLFLPPVQLAAIAQSSVQACANPANAAVCAELFGARSLAANNIVPFTRTVAASAVNSSGQVVATSGAVTATTVAAAPVGISAGTIVAGTASGFGVLAVGAAGLVTLQQQAYQAHCAANPGLCASSPNSFGVPGRQYSIYTTVSANRMNPTQISITVTAPYSAPRLEDIYWDASVPKSGFRVRITQASGVSTINGYDSFTDMYRTPQILQWYAVPYGHSEPNPAQSFQDFNSAQRQAALGRLTNQDFANAVERIALPDFQVPDGSVGIQIPGVSGATNVVDNGAITPSTTANPTIPIDGTDTDGDGIPDALDEYPDDATNTPQDANNDGLSDTVVNTQNTPIGAATFSKPNFIQYAIGKAASKFQFDIWGVAPSDPSLNECPEFEFFDREFQLCIIRDMISMLRYPVFIGFSVWAVINL